MAVASLAYALSPAVDGFGTGGASSAAPTGDATHSYRKQCAKPVDLVHLARQSLGDRELEAEILCMFRSQSTLYIDRLAHATTADERKMAAHTILGSARGIGAWDVAAEAEKVELQAAKKADLGGLRRSVEDANAYITDLLGDA